MNYKILILLSYLCFFQNVYAVGEGWTAAKISEYISDCQSTSISTITTEYKRAFINIMESSEYNAFIEGVSHQAVQACHCIVNKVKDRFSYLNAITHATAMLDYASQLSQPSAECEQNGEALLSRMRSTLGRPQ